MPFIEKNIQENIDLKTTIDQAIIGLGVAGNFAGHLEQAGEVNDFTNVAVSESNAPKGIFPFYLPSKTGHHLESFPLSSEFIKAPADQHNIQIEPEIAILCCLEYEETTEEKSKKVINIIPKQFAAYNDCSIRREGAKKISDKKNWGNYSKGVSSQLISIDKFSKGGIMDDYRIACYLGRDGRFHEYGINSPVLGYSYLYEKLINWMIEKMNVQKNDGPLESISDLLKQCDYPEYALISIGATKYTEFGETNYLKFGDKLFVIAYDSSIYSKDLIEELMNQNKLHCEGISALVQEVV